MKKLGEVIVEAGLVTLEELNKVIAQQKRSKKRLGVLIVEKGLSSELEIAHALSSQLDFPFVDLTEETISPEAVTVINLKMAKQHSLLPFRLHDDTVSIAMSDPLSFSAIDDVEFKTGFHVEPFIATPSDISIAIEKHYHVLGSLDTIVSELGDHPMNFQIVPTEEAASDVSEMKKRGEAPPIVRMVNAIIFSSINKRASDIHIEPQKTKTVVRARVDGMLRKILELPLWAHQPVVSRIKIMANLDIAEKRRPQDGRIQVRVVEGEIDLRISTIPTHCGEKVVIRILSSKQAFKPINKLGFSDTNYKQVLEVIERPQGVVLVTGPTGSGKSTSLYSFLQYLNKEPVNIVTLEDPVEYEVCGINQTQINEKAGMTFASGLRALLRQDPDIVMIGEMRDKETAEMAMRAALTGHLVFSTLHTNDAASTITRLVDIGIPHYLIASSVSALVSQRLVRVICPECKESYTPSELECEQLEIPSENREETKLYRGKGCSHCEKSGYFGRASVFEILIMDKATRDLIAAGETESTIEDAARKAGMRSLWEDAEEKVLAGITTVEEIIRIAVRKKRHPGGKVSLMT